MRVIILRLAARYFLPRDFVEGILALFASIYNLRPSSVKGISPSVLEIIYVSSH